MKKIYFLLAVGAIFTASCNCFDCDAITGFSVNTKEVVVTQNPDGTQAAKPAQIILTSSYNWTANNTAATYIDFTQTSGTGGIFHFPVSLTPEFYADWEANPDRFPQVSMGKYRVGSLNFISSQGQQIEVVFYYRTALITVTFDANGGSDAPEPVLTFAGEEGKFNLPEQGSMNHEGREFVGWNTSATAASGSVHYMANEEVFFDADITLYALWNGDGSSEDTPKYVYDRPTLEALRDDIANKIEGLHYLQIKDIDLTDRDDWKTIGGVYRPEGGGTQSWMPFVGSFDGNGYTTAYKVDRKVLEIEERQLALFGLVGNHGSAIKPGHIKNLHVKAEITDYIGTTGSVTAAGIVAILGQGSISNCWAEVNIDIQVDRGGSAINGTYICAAGIVAKLRGVNPGTVEKCVVSGTINGQALNASKQGVVLGGIAGYVGITTLSYTATTTIQDCVVLAQSMTASTQGKYALIGTVLGRNEIYVDGNFSPKDPSTYNLTSLTNCLLRSDATLTASATMGAGNTSEKGYIDSGQHGQAASQSTQVAFANWTGGLSWLNAAPWTGWDLTTIQ